MPILHAVSSGPGWEIAHSRSRTIPCNLESQSMRIAYLDCFSGISGDMLLGAFVDAGVPLDKLAAVAAVLDVGARLEARKVMRGGLTGTKVDVRISEPARSDESIHTGEAALAPASAAAHSHVHT